METTDHRKINEAVETMRNLNASKKHLKSGNLFSSIVKLREALDMMIHLKNVQQNDKTLIANAINDFQQKLAASREFNDLYGKVVFRDDDFATSYEFLSQLITIKEDEIAEVLVDEKVNQLLELDNLSNEKQKTVKLMVSLVERGELSSLRELVAANDDMGSLILFFYNENGIRQRKSGNIDKAIIEYKKALSISPDDENLYYNLARAYIESGQKKNAEICAGQAIQINPQFREGLKLVKYIKQWSR